MLWYRFRVPTQTAPSSVAWYRPQSWLSKSFLFYLGLFLLTPILVILAFEPYALWPLAFVGLVPWTFVLCRIERKGWAYLGALFSVGLMLYVLTWWLSYVTELGHVATAIIQTAYLLPVVIAIRFLHDRTRLPMMLILPTMWVAGEYFRGLGLTGFPWFYLGHPFYRQLWAIQICDLAGVYLLSFAVVMVNGLWVDIFLHRRWFGFTVGTHPPDSSSGTAPTWWRPYLSGVVIAVITWGAIALYGLYRLHESDRTMSAGPRVAVLQDDLPMTVEGSGAVSEERMLRNMIQLTERAAEHNSRPDLIAWPESMVLTHINPEFIQANLDLRICGAILYPEVKEDLLHDPDKMLTFAREELQDRAREHQTRIRKLCRVISVPLLVGATTVVPQPPGQEAVVRRFNSTMLFSPQAGLLPGRHDKLRCVPIGETVPFRYTWFHWLYRLMNDYATPFGVGGYDYSLDEGTTRQVFTLDVPVSPTSVSSSPHPPQHIFRFATPICFESTFAPFVRLWAEPQNGQKGVDFLINASNDGWFMRSSELLQHLSVCTFRAVEARVGVARAVNTGISAFIKPTGEIYGYVRQNMSNPASPYWTGLGTPEEPLVVERAKLRDRIKTEPELSDEALQSYLSRMDDLTLRINAIRAKAGVRGVSVQPVYVDTRQTLYTQIGDVFAGTLLALLFAVQFAAWWYWVKRANAPTDPPVQ